MKKTFFHKLFPSKAEEESCRAANSTYKPTRFVTEIRDVYVPPPPFGLIDPWRIKKVLTPSDINHESFVLPYTDTWEYVVRYWTLEWARGLAEGQWLSAVVWDVSDDQGNIHPVSYMKEYNGMFFQQGNESEYYVLRCPKLARDRGLKSGDEIGLFWETQTESFRFKVINKT